MRVEYNLGPLEPLGPAVLTMGAFDGVHLGHRRLAARAAELARERGAQAVAVTFWPHPATVVRPDAPLELLTMLGERLDLLAGLGLLDATVVIPFTEATAALDPEAFLDAISSWCQPVAFVEGPDFAFGRHRAGDIAFLRAAGARRGFTVETLDVRDDAENGKNGKIGSGSERVSSTHIRNLVREGQVEAATQLLGRPYMLSGEVVGGDRRGRLLGFPTANLRLDDRKLLPALGIYAVRVRLPSEAVARHAGVASIGVRPQFKSERNVLAEVYLLDATIDLYGLTIEVELVARLREERRFESVDALIAQMHRDVQQARELLASPALPAPSSVGERPAGHGGVGGEESFALPSLSQGGGAGGEDPRPENDRSDRHGRDE